MGKRTSVRDSHDRFIPLGLSDPDPFPVTGGTAIDRRMVFAPAIGQLAQIGRLL